MQDPTHFSWSAAASIWIGVSQSTDLIALLIHSHPPGLSRFEGQPMFCSEVSRSNAPFDDAGRQVSLADPGCCQDYPGHSDLLHFSMSNWNASMSRNLFKILDFNTVTHSLALHTDWGCLCQTRLPGLLINQLIPDPIRDLIIDSLNLPFV